MSFARFATLALCILGFASGCADDAVAYSEPVGITFGFKDSDAQNGTYEDGKNINTESGNPYQVFLSAARDRLGGADPGSIELTGIELFFDSSSTGATNFAQVYSSVDVYVDDLAGHTYIVGHIDTVPTSFPVRIPVTVSDADAAALQPVLKTGQFKIGLMAVVPAAAPASFDVKQTLELTFRALP